MVVWDWNYAVYSGVILAVIIISWFLLKKKKVICNHNFVSKGYINVQEKIKEIRSCVKCGQSFHISVPSKKQLKEKEDAFYERYFDDK